MLQQDKPEDFVIATGRMESVRRFIEISAEKLGWGKNNSKSIIWEGEGINEVGLRPDTKEIVIRIDSRYFRLTEVNQLLGDASKAHKKLGWKPKSNLEDLVEEMINFDNEEAARELLLIKEQYSK